MVAQDGGSPAKTATALLKLEILRNFHEPEFTPINYNATILETQALGQSILAVTAKDDDTKVGLAVVLYLCYCVNLCRHF